MAGHSKFKNIMHRKGAQDKKRAKVFTKVGREIAVAVKTGGDSDPANNPRLRAAIVAARAVNMPNDRVKKAIQSALGGSESEDYDEMRYEGYGPGGVAVLVECLTDNRNRTAAELRAAFTRAGGNLGETGSVSFSFDRVGQITYTAAAGGDGDVDLVDVALEAGADDVETTTEGHEFYCAPGDFATVQRELEAKLGDPQEAKLVWKPQSFVEVDADRALSLVKMIETMEDLDDVQAVFTNFDASDEVMETLAFDS